MKAPIAPADRRRHQVSVLLLFTFRSRDAKLAILSMLRSVKRSPSEVDEDDVPIMELIWRRCSPELFEIIKREHDAVL